MGLYTSIKHYMALVMALVVEKLVVTVYHELEAHFGIWQHC